MKSDKEIEMEDNAYLLGCWIEDEIKCQTANDIDEICKLWEYEYTWATIVNRFRNKEYYGLWWYTGVIAYMKLHECCEYNLPAPIHSCMFGILEDKKSNEQCVSNCVLCK